MMRTLLLSLVAGLGALLLTPAVATACSCRPPPGPAIALEAADVVFEGTVVGVPAEPAENAPRGFGPVEYRFAVARSWKGNPGMEVRIQTNNSGAACGRRYNKGASYVVYASAGEDETLRDSLCSRTRTLESAAEDLAAFGEGTVPTSRGGARPVMGPSDATDGEPGGEPSTEPGAVPATTAPEANADGEAVAQATAGEPAGETSQPGVAAGAEQAEAPADPPDAPAAAAEPADEDDEDLGKGPRENCSLSSADVGNTFGLVLLTGCIVALRRRIGV